MKISIIVAMDQKGVIGRDSDLPWHLSTDLQNFKRITMGKPIIMGRKTHESISKPLPGRRNIIITRNKNYEAEGCHVCHNLDEALSLCNHNDEVIVIGGRDIYALALDKVTCIYLTEVHADVMGDVFFPVFDRSEWDVVERVEFNADEKNEFAFSFLMLGKQHKLYW
ncbi:MAG: dihydrofolate reductase [Gammaproteobacteria bacterium]|jgi:dihydrofolate reductase